MASLSNKDKKLIYGCALFAVGAITYMAAIAPLSQSVSELTQTRDSNQAYLEEIQYEASMADSYEGWFEESKVKYLADREVFEDVYATENADRIFTEEVLKNNMTPLSFNISNRIYDRRLVPYGYDEQLYGYETPEYSKYIYLRNISFTCKGTFSRALKFVDELKDRSGIIISNVSFTNNKGEYSDINTDVVLSVTFDIYTYDKEGFAAENNIDLGTS